MSVFHFRGDNPSDSTFLLFNDIRHRWKTWHLPKVHVVQKNLSLAVTKVQWTRGTWDGTPWWIMMTLWMDLHVPPQTNDETKWWECTEWWDKIVRMYILSFFSWWVLTIFFAKRDYILWPPNLLRCSFGKGRFTTCCTWSLPFLSAFCLADGHTSAGVPVTMAYHGPLPGELGRSDFFTCEVLSWTEESWLCHRSMQPSKASLFCSWKIPVWWWFWFFLPFLVVPFLDEVKGFSEH